MVERGCIAGLTQKDDKYRVLPSLQAGQIEFRVSARARIQLLSMFSLLTKDYIYFIILNVHWFSKIIKKFRPRKNIIFLAILKTFTTEER